ncbi:ABC transporter substrate-binding protein [Microvirga pakistanensis]|uniref:ABC transporter substrate-binding protein n=1 Tax=Microvirga pakistanensis TaxID=1682650 RepID=UPI00106A3C01|nr:ABC transporter substrate-binding protein [Microvirga pakistanensis]
MVSRRDILLAASLFPVWPRAAENRDIKVGVLPFGTVLWEVETIRRSGLDTANGLNLRPVQLATNDAARIAFMGEQVDTIVTDLLLAARLRNEGRKVKFLPFSATEGGVMVPDGSPIRNVADLIGKRVGVAGGALDKSWLLLKADIRNKTGVDLSTGAALAYGAPPLLMNKLEAGELDAALLYWNFCARLEAKGYRRLVSAGDIAKSFGVKGEIALLGYIFRETTDPGILNSFAQASSGAKRILAESNEAWAQVRPLMSAEDEKTFQTLRRYFVEGNPRRSIEDERADAERIFSVLASIGGEKLVGAVQTFPDGLYWDGERSPP